MAPIIKCDNVSIRYITGDFKDIGLKEYLIRRLKGEYSVTEFWADRHVSFELQPGDMLGIIGSNGAGKSTILKAISGIMVPTEGTVECRGKISALLELGSGFDGDLSVRENTYLRAAMLGYSREFVDATYDSIIDFAELRGFEDRPFKQLSSGMKSRLAFSIASLVDPEILILDEVLSVGDGAFRKKSEQKMRQIISGGATTILVSHSVGQVRSLCNKILWLDHGKQIAFGNNVQGLCDAYQKYLDTKHLPTPTELPPMNVDTPDAIAVMQAKGGQEDAVDAKECADLLVGASSGSESKGHRHVPKAVWITLAVILALTAIIAVSEVRLPGVVRDLPQQAERVLYANDQGNAEVCLWENDLYLFLDRAYVESARPTLAITATDGHGFVTSGSYDVLADASRRYSTEDRVVLDVNLARFTGYVEVCYELFAAGSDQPVWEGTYVK